MSLPAACTVGVLSDTHIPDRVRALHPAILPLFQAEQVCHILHAGDVSIGAVLEQLRAVAPVTAVRGNRDIVARIPDMAQILTFGNARVALLHGHGGWLPYLWDKWKFLVYGYQRDRYLPLLRRCSQGAQVVVFGHTHFAEQFALDGRLVINPGSASCFGPDGRPPSVALLRIGADGAVQAEIVPLTGWRVQRGRWLREDG